MMEKLMEILNQDVRAVALLMAVEEEAKRKGWDAETLRVNREYVALTAAAENKEALKLMYENARAVALSR